MKRFIREKKIYCGSPDANGIVDYLEVDCFPYTDIQKITSKSKRGKKIKVSSPKQKNLNDKNSKRYFVQLAESNFGTGDLILHLTYDDEFLPATYEEALKIVTNYLRRVEYQRKKVNLPHLKYMLVTHIGKRTKRIHHHILMSGGLSRDDVEGMWWKDKGSKNKETVMYGFANARRLQPNKKGITQMAGYMAKSSKSEGNKHWTQSHGLEAPKKDAVDHNKNINDITEPSGEDKVKYSANLIQPWYRTNDHTYSIKQIEGMARTPPDRSFWEKQYKGYTLIDGDYGFIPEHNEHTGWAIYLKLRRKE